MLLQFKMFMESKHRGLSRSGGNFLKITEDTTPPTATYQIYDDDDELSQPSLVSAVIQLGCKLMNIYSAIQQWT